MFSNQSSLFLIYLQWASIKYSRTLDERIGAVPCILLNAKLIDEMAKTRINPKAQHADKTFIMAVQQTMETFEDEIGSLSDNIQWKAYKTSSCPTEMH